MGISHIAWDPRPDRALARGRDVRCRQGGDRARCRRRGTCRWRRRRSSGTRWRAGRAAAGQVHAFGGSAAGRSQDTATAHHAAGREEAAQANREADRSAKRRPDTAGGGSVVYSSYCHCDRAVGGGGHGRHRRFWTWYRRRCRSRQRSGAGIGSWARYRRRRRNRLSGDARLRSDSAVAGSQRSAREDRRAAVHDRRERSRGQVRLRSDRGRRVRSRAQVTSRRVPFSARAQDGRDTGCFGVRHAVRPVRRTTQDAAGHDRMSRLKDRTWHRVSAVRSCPAVSSRVRPLACVSAAC